MFILIATTFLLLIDYSQCGMNATAILHPPFSELNPGKLLFTQDNAGSEVRITGKFCGMNASSAHGFHIHTNAVSENSPNCTAAGPHFNPYNTKHGPQTANITSRHVGDLGNITADENGDIEIDFEDELIQLYNATQSIIGRTVVLHLLRDDGGEGGFDDSNTTGNAGLRLICGLITLLSTDETTTTITTTTSITATPESSTTTSGSSTSSEVTSASSETPTSETTIPPSDNSTTPSTGLKIQPIIFILLITMIIDYLIRY